MAKANEFLAENTAKAVRDGRYLSISYFDLLHKKPPQEITDPSREAEERLKRMGIEVIKNECI